MWGSVIGGVLGALVGGGVTYYVQVRREAEKKHRETVKELRHDMHKLSADIQVALNMVASKRDVYPDDVYANARDIELKAIKLTDEELKKDVIETLNKEYDSVDDVDTSLWELCERLDRRAFPTLHEMKKDYTDVEEMKKRLFGDGDEIEWAGPASSDFLNKASEEGYMLRTEVRRDS